MRGRKGGAKKQPRNMTVVWCLMGLLVGGLLLTLFQTGGEQEKKPRRPQIRRTVKEEVVKPAPVVVPEEVVQSKEENPSPEPPEKSEPVPEENPNVPSESAAPEELPNVPDASSPDEPDTEADAGDDEDSQDRESRLRATAPNGEYYIDMETRSLLFTDDASLNDENLEIYLEETYAKTESERYDEEAAERTDENKQVK